MAPELHYSKLPKWKYRLEKDYRYWTPLRGLFIDTQFLTLQENGWLTIRAGYAWDGSTCVPDTKNSQPASLVHDAMYQLMREGRIDREHRAIADRMYYDLCIEYGMWTPRAWTRWRGVRRGAGFATKPRPAPEIIVVT